MGGEYREKNIVIKDKDSQGKLRTRLIRDAEFWFMGDNTIIRSHTETGIERVRLGDEARVLSLDEAVAEFHRDPLIGMRARARITFGNEDGGSNRPFTMEANGGTIK